MSKPVWFFSVMLWGCGSAPPVTAEPLEVSGPNDWAEREFDAKHENMIFTLLPSMAVRFQEHNGTESAELTCYTCHGDDAEQVSYRMPNGLLPLDPNAIPQTDEARWMAEVVTPFADRIMNAGGTTTCFTCHERSPL